MALMGTSSVKKPAIDGYSIENGIYIYIPMDPSTFLGSVWGIIYYNLEA